MDNELSCNFKKCRNRLDTHVWVTSCSHIFCDEDGTREFKKSFTCPACNTSLPGKFDIVRAEISPSEQYKSMVLAGQKPENIMEICSRALAFWNYQVHQKTVYYEHSSNKFKERITQMEQYYDQVIGRVQAEINTLKSQLASTKKNLEEKEKKLNESCEKLREKGRQYQKLQSMYEALRRKCISPSKFECDLPSTPRHRNNARAIADCMPFAMSSGADLLRDARGDGDRPQSPPERDFVLRPNVTPALGHDTSSIQSRFNMELNTPTSRRQGPKK